jgi:hypothetical protein
MQKQVLLATWNLRARPGKLPEAGYESARSTILEMELAVLQQVEALAQEAASPESAEELRQLAEELVLAIKALESARGGNAGAGLTRAERHERAAYELILNSPSEEMLVARSSSMSSAAQRQNPAELNELELDRNRNFYEEENRPSPESAEADAALERLRELAARQALINEEIARLVSELESARTEEERAEIQRRLERLKEEIRQTLEQTDELERQLQSGSMSPQELREAMEKLDEARRQNASTLDSLATDDAQSSEESSSLQKARTSSRRALDALNSLEDELTERSRTSVEDRLRHFSDRFQEFIADENAFQDLLAEWSAESHGPGLRMPEDMEDQRTEFRERSHRAVEEFVGMMESAGTLAAAAEATQPLVARRFGDWLRETSGSGVAEDLESTRDALDDGLWSAAEEAQGDANRNLIAAGGALDRLLELLVRDESDAMRVALEQMNQLMEAAGLPQVDADASGASMESAEQQGLRPKAAPRDAGAEADTKGRPTSGTMEPNERGEPGAREPGGEEPSATAESMDHGSGDPQSGDEAPRPSFRIAWGEEAESAESRSERAGGEPGSSRSEEPGRPESASDSTRPDGEAEGDGRFNDRTAAGSERDRSDAGEPTAAGGSEAAAGEEDEEPVGERSGRSDETGISTDELMPSTPREMARGEVGTEGDPQGRGTSRTRDLRDWPVDPQKLLGEDYRDWIERLRGIQAVLGDGDPASEQLDAVALRMEQLRREFRRTGLEPRFDLFLKGVAMPLEAVAADLEMRLQRAALGGELPILQAEEVPVPYQQLVAEYFESLSRGVESAGE